MCLVQAKGQRSRHVMCLPNSHPHSSNGFQPIALLALHMTCLTSGTTHDMSGTNYHWFV